MDVCGRSTRGLGGAGCEVLRTVLREGCRGSGGGVEGFTSILWFSWIFKSTF